MWVAASQSWVAQLDEAQGRALAQYVEALRAKYVEEAQRCGELQVPRSRQLAAGLRRLSLTRKLR